MKATLKILFLLLTIQLNYGTNAQTQVVLEATQTTVSLPAPDSNLASIYDGNDGIYLFFGVSGTITIFRYNIGPDTLDKIGTLPEVRFGGNVVMGNDWNIYYFGGQSSGSKPYNSTIYRLNPRTKETSLVGTFNFSMVDGVVAMRGDGSNHVLLIGGWSNINFQEKMINCMDLNTAAPCGSSRLINSYRKPTLFLEGSYAFIFDGRNLERIDLKRMQSVAIQTTPMLPELTRPKVISDGTFGYILNGWADSPFSSIETIIQFDPMTFTLKYIPVQYFLNDQMYPNSAVYVEKLNRIYVFRGYEPVVDRISNEIVYIDLEPINAKRTTTTIRPDIMDNFCTNRTEGLYPHPLSCSKFVACYDDAATPYYFECPNSKFYEPRGQECLKAELVECKLDCGNKKDGRFAHPYECNMFLLCKNGKPEVHQCELNKEFHAGVLNCLRPQLVRCKNSKFYKDHNITKFSI